MVFGVIDGQPIIQTARDRSMHTVRIGATGTGKTTAMELSSRQDIAAGHGLCIIDPMGPLFDRTLAFCAYRKAIGCKVPEVIPCNPADGEWVLPYNPFAKGDGDISVQVDRRVQALLRAWGQTSSDYRPRMEKWLKCLFTVLVECNLTIIEAAWLIDQHASEIREFLMAGLSDPFIRKRLEQLASYRPAEFLDQIESVENRLMRFLCSRTVSTMMGLGPTALDFAKAMDQGQVVLFKLKPSKFLSREQSRLIGTTVINGFYEAAIERQSGSRPFYLYVDEAARFVTPEIGDALEECRQKGLHFDLAFQHLAQFKTEDLRLYKAVKNNARNKFVFAVPDRVDASELADDLFPGLANPEIKFVHKHLNHLIEDVREQSITNTDGRSQNIGSRTMSGLSHTTGSAETSGLSFGKSRSLEQGGSKGRTFSRNHTKQTGKTSGHTHTEHEAHSRGFSETNSSHETSGQSSSETIHEHDTEGIFFDTSDDSRSKTQGESSSRSKGYSRTETGNDSYDSGDSYSDGTSETSADGTTVAWSKISQHAKTASRSRTFSRQNERSQSRSQSQSRTESADRGQSFSRSTTDQPGVRHHPFIEEDPEHWKLEEQRWKAAEIIMRQPLGHCIVSTASGRFGQASIPLPRKFYVLPKVLQRLTEQFYQRHCVRFDEAEKLIAERQQKLLSAAKGFGPQQGAGSCNPDDVTWPGAPAAAEPIWPRVKTIFSASPPASEPVTRSDAAKRKRGPKPDLQNHAKVQSIVEAHGVDWSTDDHLEEICEELDKARVPVPKPWPIRRDGKARSWSRAFSIYPHLVVKAIKDRLKAASGGQSSGGN